MAPSARGPRARTPRNSKRSEPTPQPRRSLSLSRARSKDRSAEPSPRNGENATRRKSLHALHRDDGAKTAGNANHPQSQHRHRHRRSLPRLSMTYSKEEQREAAPPSFGRIRRLHSGQASARYERPSRPLHGGERNVGRQPPAISAPLHHRKRNTAALSSSPVYASMIPPQLPKPAPEDAHNFHLSRNAPHRSTISASSSAIFKPFPPLFCDISSSSSPYRQEQLGHVDINKRPTSQPRKARSVSMAPPRESTHHPRRSSIRSPMENPRSSRRSSFQIRNSITRTVRRVIHRKPGDNGSSLSSSSSCIPLSNKRRESSRF